MQADLLQVSVGVAPACLEESRWIHRERLEDHLSYQAGPGGQTVSLTSV